MTDETTEPARGLFGPGIFGTGIDLSALDEDTALRLGIWTGEAIKDGEERGYERAAKELQGLRVLLVDADGALSRAGENDEDVAMFHRAWKARLRLTLEDGEYPGLTTRLLDSPDELGRDLVETLALVDQAVDQIPDSYIEDRLRQALAPEAEGPSPVAILKAEAIEAAALAILHESAPVVDFIYDPNAGSTSPLDPGGEAR
jgi:hypothetical protein